MSGMNRHRGLSFHLENLAAWVLAVLWMLPGGAPQPPGAMGEGAMSFAPIRLAILGWVACVLGWGCVGGACCGGAV